MTLPPPQPTATKRPRKRASNWWIALGVGAGVLVVILNVTDSEFIQSLVWVLLILGFFCALIFLAWRLYKMGKRRATPGWWIAAILGAVSLIVLPFVGCIVAALVLFVDRNSK